MPSESDFLKWVAQQQQQTSPMVKLAAGDDLAILNWRWDLLLVGVDQVLDAVHFDSNVHSPRAIGRKAMNRNLSDCAAMACFPAAALVSAALPKGRGIEYAKALYLGIKEAGEKFDCPIVGGETGTWDGRLAVTVTILGRQVGFAPLTRRGAEPGDSIYVTGPLGGSLLGRHMTFEPRVRLGISLAAKKWAKAMIDLSDGLSRDLRHICDASGVGAIVEADRIPVHEDAIEMRRDGRSPLEHALHDGEDYELLFTSPFHAPQLVPPEGVSPYPCVRIGRIVAESGVWLEKDGQRAPLEPQAWEHTF